MRQIATNAGLEGSVIVNKVKELSSGMGFNALTEEYVEMVDAGILDPTKVTRSALQNATSVASTFLTTENKKEYHILLILFHILSKLET